MEKIVSRQKNLIVLALVVAIQVLALGVQVKRPSEAGPVSLVRVWTIRAVTPFEKALVHTRNWAGDTWQSYFYLRGLKAENERLEDENAQLRMQQVRMIQDASQAQRLQALLKFKEQFVSETVPAQVIGTSGTESSRILYIDKGSDDGIKNDMAVITPGGIVGKIIRVLPGSSQVLEINDQTSGIGVILEKSRLQGILKGTSSGDVLVHYIMSDEKVETGETVLTSGGDRIFPKGMMVGTVVSVNPGKDMFLNIRVKPSARLDRVEEVLVITKVDERQPDLLPENPMRAADILAAKLPSVPVKPPEQAAQAGAPGQGTQPQSAGTAGSAAVVPAAQRTAATQKPAIPGSTTVNKPTPGAPNNSAQGGAPANRPVTPAQKTGAALAPAAQKPASGSAKPVSATTKPGSSQTGGQTGSTGGGSKPATAKPGESNVFINGNGVKHISDVPTAPAKPAKKNGPVSQQPISQ